MPETQEEIKQSIEDFVNLYSAMYKNSKNTSCPLRLVRGDSNRRVKSIDSSIPQILSTSRDMSVAKTFCQYGDAAIIHFEVEQGVPYLDPSLYKDENSKEEYEIILSPFCKVVQKQYYGEYEGYTEYRITVAKPELEEKSTDELNKLYGEIVSNYLQNLESIREYTNIQSELEILEANKKRAIEHKDFQEAKDIMEASEEIWKQKFSLEKSINEYREKLQILLQGMCKAKELEIDEAKGLIDENIQRQKEEIKAKKNEETRKNLISEISVKLSQNPQENVNLKDSILQTYQELLSNEEKARKFSEKLGISLEGEINSEDIEQLIGNIQSNLETIETKTDNIEIKENTSLEDVEKIYGRMMPLFDGVSYGVEIARDFPEITTLHSEQLMKDIKARVYDKVQTTLKNARIQKYSQEKEEVANEKIGWFGKLRGKDTLKNEKLKNINLKIQLEEKAIPPKQEQHNITDMLVDIYVCALSELDGQFTPEMKTLYSMIKSSFKETQEEQVTEDYIKQLANKKITEATPTKFPAIQDKKYRARETIKTQTQNYMASNKILQDKLSECSKTKSTWNCAVEDNDAVELFKQKLKEIDNKTKEKESVQIDLDKTLE